MRPLRRGKDGLCGARPQGRLKNGYDYYCESCKCPPCSARGLTPGPKMEMCTARRLPQWTCAPCRQRSDVFWRLELLWAFLGLGRWTPQWRCAKR
eukprot:5988140-Pyramimonas_sp.AAC.1